MDGNVYGWPVAKDARIDVMSANNRYWHWHTSLLLFFSPFLLSSSPSFLLLFCTLLVLLSLNPILHLLFLSSAFSFYLPSYSVPLSPHFFLIVSKDNIHLKFSWVQISFSLSYFISYSIIVILEHVSQQCVFLDRIGEKSALFYDFLLS